MYNQMSLGTRKQNNVETIDFNELSNKQTN